MSEDLKIPANLRTLYIMEILSNSDGPMTATAIGQALGLPKQTIHRLCNTLLQEGFITKAHFAKGFLPARRMRNIASGIAHLSKLHVARHQILKNLAKDIGETINFAVPGDGGMVYIDRVETDWPFRIQLPVGSGVPFHCTASGKLFLGSQSKRDREKIVSNITLEKVTQNTIEDIDQLKAAISKANKAGYALDNEEFIEGMVAVAVPVCDSRGKFFGAIAFHGPTIRLSVEIAEAKIPILKQAAKKIEEVLFLN